MAKPLLREDFTLISTTVKWHVSHMAAGDGRRPRKGDETVDFPCSRCRKRLRLVLPGGGRTIRVQGHRLF
ncbi:hypothetical protein [Streptomyces goshikiensis]|uniref:hypothetical protein n=1 Tax=Streptomyces goshikiensis TaxID=1942 RepID=UPI003675BBE0